MDGVLVIPCGVFVRDFFIFRVDGMKFSASSPGGFAFIFYSPTPRLPCVLFFLFLFGMRWLGGISIRRLALAHLPPLVTRDGGKVHVCVSRRRVIQQGRRPWGWNDGMVRALWRATAVGRAHKGKSDTRTKVKREEEQTPNQPRSLFCLFVSLGTTSPCTFPLDTSFPYSRPLSSDEDVLSAMYPSSVLSNLSLPVNVWGSFVWLWRNQQDVLCVLRSLSLACSFRREKKSQSKHTHEQWLQS